MQSNIEEVNFGQAISERYLSYALSTIMSRSLPDVRDGLKPVHRRLLYAMLKLKLDPGSGYKKCARVVGDVIGKYHPHGDTAVYDTLVRLAQNFSLRYPLIEGQGNFGSIDGDNAAAMRYTESKMTNICMLLMHDINKDTVDYLPTYDDSDLEPSLLPASFPNLLANGSEGIAVGMATSIPPHNLAELCDALIYLIQHPKQATTEQLLQFIKGPDFPTGGVIIDSSKAIAQGYQTGRGGFKLRARWTREELSHGLYQIVITEIPYQVQKSKLIEQIAQLMRDKKVPLIANIRDESTEDIRLIIEPKSRLCDAETIMQALFKQSLLETRINLNMNVLSSDGAPKVMNLLEICQEFLAYRQQIVLRRSKFDLAKIAARLEILAALKIVYLNIDQVISIIRNEDEPKTVLMQQFALNDVQAEAILNLKLRSLKKLEEQQIDQENQALLKEQQTLTKIVNEDKYLWKVIQNELTKVKQQYALETDIGARKTSFEEVDQKHIDIAAFVEREAVTIICSKRGWVRSMRGHNLDLSNIKYKEGDSAGFIVETYTTDNLLICASNGKIFTLLADNIVGGKSSGQPINLLIASENAEIINIFPAGKQQILLINRTGKGFIAEADKVVSTTRTGKQIMNTKEGNECISCIPLKSEDDAIALIGTNRKLIVVDLEQIPVMQRGQGVVLQKYRQAELSDAISFTLTAGLSWNLGKKTRIENDITNWRAHRGSIGKLPPNGFPKNNKFN